MAFMFLLMLFFLAGFTAYRKGRSVIGAVLLSFIFTPVTVIGLVLLLGPDYIVLYGRKYGTETVEDKMFNWKGITKV
jgi:hypothetical protein